MIGIDAESAHPDNAEILVADGDRVRRAPFLVKLGTRREEVNIGLERGFEELVPVFQVSKNGQRLRRQLVHAGAENVGHGAFVDEHRHLRVAHRQAGTILDFHFLHRETPGQRAVALLGPLQDVDKLFLDEIHQGHNELLK